MSRRQVKRMIQVGGDHHRRLRCRARRRDRRAVRVGAAAGAAERGRHGFVVPVGQLVVYLMLAGLAGVLVAIWPARRAAS